MAEFYICLEVSLHLVRVFAFVKLSIKLIIEFPLRDFL